MADESTTQGACPFCDILNGVAPGTIIARDDEKRVALIRSIHPESGIHWLAVPTDHIDSTEAFEKQDARRFLDLIEFASAQVRAHRDDYPQLYRGYSIKMHFGSYETIPHAKLHILGTE